MQVCEEITRRDYKARGAVAEDSERKEGMVDMEEVIERFRRAIDKYEKAKRNVNYWINTLHRKKDCASDSEVKEGIRRLLEALQWREACRKDVENVVRELLGLNNLNINIKVEVEVIEKG